MKSPSLINKFVTNSFALTVGVMILKALIYLLFISSSKNLLLEDTIFIDNPDRSEYLRPIDNFVDHGHYSLSPEGEPYAGRLPGYVLPYLPIRLIFNQLTSIWLLGLFTLLMSAIATFKLIKLFKKNNSPWWLIALLITCIEVLPYYWHWDWAIHPNSLAVSCLILSFCSLQNYFESQKKSSLLAAGFFIAWVFMLRGFTFLFIPATLLVIFVFQWKQKKKTITNIIELGIFILPLFMAEASWIGRNYISLHKFIPLQTTFVPGNDNINNEYGYRSYTKYSMLKLREMINCWGGDNFWYFKNADMKWFTDDENKLPASVQFNASVFTGKITPELLDELKGTVVYSFNPSLNQNQHDSIEKIIVEKSTNLKREFMSNKAWYFYTVAPFKRISNLAIKNTTQDWPGKSFKESGILEKIFKLLSLALYVIGSVSLIFALPFMWKKHKSNPLFQLLLLYFLSVVLVFALVINSAHYSYFMYGFVPATILLFALINEKLKVKSQH